MDANVAQKPFDADGKPTRAAIAFADGLNVAVDDLDRLTTDKGEWLIFRGEDEPSKHHVVQVWQTPYVSAEFASSEKKDSFLYN